MTSTGEFYDLLRAKLEGTDITVHALYRRVKWGLAGKEYYLSGMFEKGDTKKYFDAKMESDKLPTADVEIHALAEHVAGELRKAFKPSILMK